MRLKVGDQVEVVSGEDKGVRGAIQRVILKKNRVVVAGVNMVKKHQKAQPTGGAKAQGGIIEFEAPIDISNVMLVCPTEGVPTRVGVRRNEDGKRVRFSKKSGKDLE